MRPLALILALTFAAMLYLLAGCDTVDPTRCPAPWLPDACPDSLRY